MIRIQVKEPNDLKLWLPRHGKTEMCVGNSRTAEVGYMARKADAFTNEQKAMICADNNGTPMLITPISVEAVNDSNEAFDSEQDSDYVYEGEEHQLDVAQGTTLYRWPKFRRNGNSFQRATERTKPRNARQQYKAQTEWQRQRDERQKLVAKANEASGSTIRKMTGASDYIAVGQEEQFVKNIKQFAGTIIQPRSESHQQKLRKLVDKHLKHAMHKNHSNGA